jgi:hypothetical protein
MYIQLIFNLTFEWGREQSNLIPNPNHKKKYARVLQNLKK